jgi:hypothetical protein
VAVVGQLEIVLLVAAVLVRQSFSPLQRAYTGLPRPLLKFSGGSVDILRDVFS